MVFPSIPAPTQNIHLFVDCATLDDMELVRQRFFRENPEANITVTKVELDDEFPGGSQTISPCSESCASRMLKCYAKAMAILQAVPGSDKWYSRLYAVSHVVEYANEKQLKIFFPGGVFGSGNFVLSRKIAFKEISPDREDSGLEEAFSVLTI